MTDPRNSDLNTKAEDLLLAFEAAWEKGGRPDPAAFWPQGSSVRLLAELLHIDLQRRLEQGESGILETYVSRFPMIEHSDVVRELLESELRIRRKFGSDPLPDLCRRFPAHANALRAKSTPIAATIGPAHPHASPAPAKKIQFACADCGRSYSVPTEFAGRTTKCRGCGKDLAIPAPREPAPQTPDPRSLQDETVGMAPASQPLPLATPISPTGGRYRYFDEIARGGMGVVLRAADEEIQREVAVKRLLDDSDSDSKLRFIREAQITGQLEHPNIVPVHDLGLDERKRLFFAMKLVKGQSLAQALDCVRKDSAYAGKEFSLPRLLTVFVNVCNALAYAHSKNIVHRDLKPANIMIGDFGAVYLMDWGLAKPVGDDGLRFQSADTSPLAKRVGIAEGSRPAAAASSPTAPFDATQDGSILGTPVYMSPEQATGRVQEIDERSDIYSLGAILYEILTLRPPIDRTGGYPEILRRVAEGRITSPTPTDPTRYRDGRVPPELAAIAMKAMALRPESRYASVVALRRDIERYLEGKSVSAKDDSVRETILKYVKRNRSLTAAATTIFVFLIGATLWTLSVERRSRAEIDRTFQAFQNEQKEKETRTRQAVPALLKAAQLDVHQGRLDDAMRNVSLVLEFRPNDAEAHLLKGELLMAQQKFDVAAIEFAKCLDQKPSHADARELRQLCLEYRLGDEAAQGLLIEMGRKLIDLEHPALAQELVRPHGDSLAGLREFLYSRWLERVEKVWRPLVGGAPRQLTLRNEKFVFTADRTIDSLAPLEGIPLHSLALFASKIKDFTPLTRMPLRDLTLLDLRTGDLSFLKGSLLETLTINGCTEVLDLSDLNGLPIKHLRLQNCGRIAGFDAVKGMPLESFAAFNCPTLSSFDPLRGAPLTKVDLTSCPLVSTLDFLSGMPLKELDLSGCESIQSIEALRGLPLESLKLSGTKVSDLTPLKGSRIDSLSLRGCIGIQDIRPLQGMPLRTLDLFGCKQLEDVAKLQGMPLREIDLGGTAIRRLPDMSKMPLLTLNLRDCGKLFDIVGIREAPVSQLDLSGCELLTDLAPLRSMSLNSLTLEGSDQLEDLGPLKGLPLNSLTLVRCKKIKSLAPLRESLLIRIEIRECPALQSLDGLQNARLRNSLIQFCPSLESLEGLRGARIDQLHLRGCDKLRSLAGIESSAMTDLTIEQCESLRDVAAIRGLRLNRLMLFGCPELDDLSALKELQIQDLSLALSKLKDISALKTMPLTKLNIGFCPEVRDLSPLASTKLTDIQVPPGLEDYTPLLNITTLQFINRVPPATFFRELKSK